MAFPSERSEISGALIVAVGLILGGVLTHICDRLDLPTPGLLSRRPSTVEAEAALSRRNDDASALGDVNGEKAGPRIENGGGGLKSNGQFGKSESVDHSPDSNGPPSRLRVGRLGPIEINSAGAEELQQLDGIGPALAGRIVDFRRQNGPFRRMEDLLDVRGIGPATLAKIKNTARLGGFPEGSQNTLRTSTSSHVDSSSFQR